VRESDLGVLVVDLGLDSQIYTAWGASLGKAESVGLARNCRLGCRWNLDSPSQVQAAESPTQIQIASLNQRESTWFKLPQTCDSHQVIIPEVPHHQAAPPPTCARAKPDNIPLTISFVFEIAIRCNGTRSLIFSCRHTAPHYKHSAHLGSTCAQVCVQTPDPQTTTSTQTQQAKLPRTKTSSPPWNKCYSNLICNIDEELIRKSYPDTNEESSRRGTNQHQSPTPTPSRFQIKLQVSTGPPTLTSQNTDCGDYYDLQSLWSATQLTQRNNKTGKTRQQSYDSGQYQRKRRLHQKKGTYLTYSAFLVHCLDKKKTRRKKKSLQKSFVLHSNIGSKLINTCKCSNLRTPRVVVQKLFPTPHKAHSLPGSGRGERKSHEQQNKHYTKNLDHTKRIKTHKNRRKNKPHFALHLLYSNIAGLKHHMAAHSSKKVARVLIMDEEELMEIDSPQGTAQKRSTGKNKELMEKSSNKKSKNGEPLAITIPEKGERKLWFGSSYMEQFALEGGTPECMEDGPPKDLVAKGYNRTEVEELENAIVAYPRIPQKLYPSTRIDKVLGQHYNLT
jgi:hypothetical protein